MIDERSFNYQLPITNTDFTDYTDYTDDHLIREIREIRLICVSQLPITNSPLPISNYQRK